MPWIREGECPPERCKGRCCEHVGLWIDDRAVARAFAVRGMKVAQKDGKYLVDTPQRCQYLTARGKCSLHPALNPPPHLPRRPQFCADWPQEPSQLLNDPQCGFTFRWEDEELPIGAKG